MTPIQYFFGIDIDQVHLTIARSDEPGVVQIANTSEAISAWLATLPENSALAVESSGRCQRLLLALAVAAGRRIYLLNAYDVRRYAQGIGRRAKTDRVDATVIARYLAREHDTLHLYQPPSNALATLEILLKRRAGVVQAQTSLRQSLADLDELATPVQALFQQFATLLAALERRLIDVIAQDESTCRLYRHLGTIPGVGPIVGAVLVGVLERLPQSSADALVAFVGLDPRADDSGARQGRRRLSKRGWPEARRLLYLAATTFARGALGKPLYQRYRQRGLSTTASTVILARKILRIAHALRTHDCEFDPRRIAMA